MRTSHLLDVLNRYVGAYPESRGGVEDLRALISRHHEAATSRKTFDGHVTTGM